MEEEMAENGESVTQERSQTFGDRKACIQDGDVTSTAGLPSGDSAENMTSTKVTAVFNTEEPEYVEEDAVQSDAVMVAVSVSDSNIPISEIEDGEGKLSEGEASPPMDDNLGRRKRKPSRYHDSMFDIPTNLLNISRIINPEEFRAFHSKGVKQKEKFRKIAPAPSFVKSSKTTKLETIPDVKDSPCESPEEPSVSYSDYEDDVLDTTNTFKFKMRKDHIIQNAMGGPTAYKCDVCLMTFPRSFSLRRHYTRRHINPKYVAQKTENGAKNVIAGNSQQGAADIYGGEDNKFLYACKMCSKDLIYFKHKNELHCHCLEHHTTEPRRPASVFKCDICKRSYSTRHELERHKRTHSGERPYSCGYCQKTFPTSTNARRHERTHTGDRPHICKVCSKGFIQRTDMVKHLRAIHKMKVTKTKAQKSGFSANEGKGAKGRLNPTNAKGYGMDSNEFQENIDFAAYLNLDQHISGTLMGEEASRPTFSGKDAESNKAKTGHSPINNNLKDLPPSQIIGQDGKLEKIHRCPDCSKMFTSNINLRRHYKLKHERNQIYQSAEPVSMVVEKYKIMDDGVPVVTKEGEKTKDISSTVREPPELSNKDETVKTPSDDQNPVPEENNPPSTDISNKKDGKGKHSKLSSIVQRLASKINAENSNLSDSEVTSTSVETTEKQPITQLQEFGDQIFRQSSPKNNAASPKRNKRKPTSVQHVPMKEPAKEIIRDEMKHKIMMPDRYKQTLRRNQLMPRTDKPSSSAGGIYRKVLETGSHTWSSMDQMNRHQYEDYTRKNSVYEAMGSPHLESRLRCAEFSNPNMREPTDLSKSFIHGAPDYMPTEKHYRQPRHDRRGDASRIETFLSQCYSSKKCDVPQNAILDRNVPIRDSNAMNRKLKYNMKHLSTERLNEHLPPTAYFSQRDRVFSPDSKERSPDQANVDKKCHPNEGEIPLDLRIASKKETQDYIVRDDGVLDFSQKTRNSIGKSKSESEQQTLMSPQDHPHVKIEPYKNVPMYPDQRYNEPYSRQYHEDIPPWLQGSHHKFLNSGQYEPTMNPMMDPRRDMLHGQPPSSKPNKSYKFHCMDYRPPYGGPPPPMDYKTRMPQNLGSYRDHPYMPMHSLGRGSLVMGRRRYTPPNMYAPPKDDSRPHSSDKRMQSRMAHKHFPPSAHYNAGPMPIPRYPHQSRETLPSYPGQSANQKWQHDHRRDSRAIHADQPNLQPSNLRHILPKGNWKNDMLLKSGWKDDQRPIPSSIQRLAMKKSQGPSPFDRWDIFDDRDMMNRCIKKAQQSLKREPLIEAVKQTKGDIFNRGNVAFKANPNMQSYFQKLGNEKLVSLSTAKMFSTSSPSVQRRVPPFVQKSSVRSNVPVSQSKTDARAQLYEVLNLTTLMKSPPSYRQEHNTIAKESLGQREVSREELGDREKLTMTPGLESTHEATESILSKTRDCDNISEDTHADCLRKISDDDKLPSTSDFTAIDLVKCDLSVQSTSDSMSEKDKSKSNIIDSMQSSAKLLNRRHTHAHPGDESYASQDEDGVSTDQRRGLKRSCSNDSTQGDSLSDEGDGAARKLIKKLKLRVIKSPGSEHKKYWTLVNQDGPHKQRLATTEGDLPITNEQCIPMETPQIPCDSTTSHSDPVPSQNSNNDDVEDIKTVDLPKDHEELESHQLDTLDVDSQANCEYEFEDNHVVEEPEFPEANENLVDEAETTPSTDDIVDNVSTDMNIVTDICVETTLTGNENEGDNVQESVMTTILDDEYPKLDENTDDIQLDQVLNEDTLETTENHEEEEISASDVPIINMKEEIIIQETAKVEDNAENIATSENKHESQIIQQDSTNDIIVDTPDTRKVPDSTSENVKLPEDNCPISSRTTRSANLSTAPARLEKPIISERKQSNSSLPAKKTEVSTSAESTANRLRRSVRIRKTSADKDAIAKKKK